MRRGPEPLERPEGLLYETEVVGTAEERELLGRLGRLDFDPIVIRGQAARRTARHYGVEYDYEGRRPLPSGPPVPAWLLPLRGRCAALAGVEADALAEALVQRYPPGAGIGWHRDAPAFGLVVGVSLGSDCRLRFRRGKAGARTLFDLDLAPRSAYVLAGPVRWSWQHSIPASPELRYSVTFRTLRG